MGVVIQVSCIVRCTSIFTCQISWLGLFLSVDLNSLAQIKQLVTLLYSLQCSWVSRFIGILLARCCLQMVAATKICSKNFSGGSSPIFTWGGSKDCPSLHFMQMQLPHGICCWYWVVKDFDDDDSHQSSLRRTLSKSTQMAKGKRSWYSVFVSLTFSCPFLSSASVNLILCAPCNLHLSKWFFNTSLLVQPCKRF